MLVRSLRQIIRSSPTTHLSSRNLPLRLFSSELNPRVCPNCSAPLPTALPTCLNCSHIAPIPSETRYHSLFRIPFQDENPYHVDMGLLRRGFLQAQSVCHPDAWSGRGQKEQNIAASQSSLLNKAYQTLRSPLERAEYLLSLEGIPLEETEKLDEKEFIMEIMEAREELEDATSVEDVEAARAANKERINRTIEQLGRAFSAKDYVTAKKETIRLRYWDGIDAAAKERIDTLSTS